MPVQASLEGSHGGFPRSGGPPERSSSAWPRTLLLNTHPFQAAASPSTASLIGEAGRLAIRVSAFL
jgi:hypothetical protein